MGVRVPSSAPASSQGDIYHGKCYRLPFIFTPATRRRSKAFGFDFLTKNLSLSLAPPLSPKLVLASLPHFVCFIFNKKNSRHNWGNFYRFCKFIQSYVKLLPLHFLINLRMPKSLNALHFSFQSTACKILRNLFRRKRKNKPLKLKLHRSFAK